MSDREELRSGTERLRALLAEARVVARGVAREADGLPFAQWSREQHRAHALCQRIDAALAEPVAVPPEG